MINQNPDSRVILVRPVSAEDRKILTSPAKLCKILETSPYNKTGISDVRVNMRRQLLAIELERTDKDQINFFLNLKKIGTWNVTCALPSQAGWNSNFDGSYIISIHQDQFFDPTKLFKAKKMNFLKA